MAEFQLAFDLEHPGRMGKKRAKTRIPRELADKVMIIIDQSWGIAA